MIGKIARAKHGGLVISPEQSQVADEPAPHNPPPTSPAETTVSSSTAANSPAAPPRADPKLQALLQLVTETFESKRSIDKEDDWLRKENNSLVDEQAEIDRLQEIVSERRRAWEGREEKAKRARASFNAEMTSIERRITHPDDDPSTFD